LSYDAVIVPGGGVRSGGSVAPWVINRLDRALDRCGSAPILCLSAGTPNRPPPLDETGRPVLESFAAARYLLSRGFPAHRIYVDVASLDTIGNAYFARVAHTDLRGWLRLLVVNSEFHMPRTEAVFRWVFGLAPGVEYSLEFDAVPNAGMEPYDLAARISKEKASLAKLQTLVARIRTLGQLHEFLFTAHDAYSAAGLLKPRAHSPELDRTY
jgi:uncharacterized SAM-binding protein YcdF (DUF218 family)